jgi:hypothetical protein
MNGITIPKKRIAGVLALAALSDSQVDIFSKEIELVEPTLSISAIAKEIAESAFDITPEDAEDVIDSFLPMYISTINNEVSVDDFILDIQRSLQTQVPSETGKFDDQIGEQLGRNLGKLLRLKTIERSTRAGQAIYDNEKTLATARILTDVRPIYESTSTSTSIVGFVALHSLNLSIVSESWDDQKQFRVSLDLEDIDSLIAALTIAKSQALEVKKTADKLGVFFVQNGPEGIR